MSDAASSSSPGPSRTSQAVAVTRERFLRPATAIGDPHAQTHLCEGMPAVVMTDRVPSLRARTTFVDEAVLAAVSDGIRQIVIVGAGYDDRALRFRSPGVHFIEVDHPATQSDKARRLRSMTDAKALPTLAAADFAHDDVGPVLERARHDPALPTLFIGEGLLAYLDQATIIRLLSGVHSRAARGSRLIVSLATHAVGIDSERVTTAANAQRRAGATEPWLTILPLEEHLALLRRAGWHVDGAIDQVELEPSAPAGRSVFATARPIDDISV